MTTTTNLTIRLADAARWVVQACLQNAQGTFVNADDSSTEMRAIQFKIIMQMKIRKQSLRQLHWTDGFHSIN